MSQIDVAVIVGSLRKDSVNRQLANGLAKLAPPDFSLRQIRIDDLPLYNQDDDGTPTEPVSRLRNEIRSAHALLFVTPEYNRSVPGVLKNAIDHGSRPYGQSVWAGKAAGVLGASIGPMGTAMAQQHLRNILAYLDVCTMGQPEAFVKAGEGFVDENGEIGPKDRKFLQGWMDRYVAFVKRQTA